MPPWWDLLTLGRLLITAALIAGWFAVGWHLAPSAWRLFDDLTAGYVRWMQAEFDKMFVEVRATWCVAAIVGSVLVSAYVGWFITSALPFVPLGYNAIRAIVIGLLVVGPLGLPLGYSLPRFLVEQFRERRARMLEDQLLDALAFMSNGLKSGLSLLQAMDMVRKELPDPIAQEFALTLNEQRLGVPIEDALLGLEKRIGSEDIQIVVTSINILRQSGGNLAETFDTVANTIRERKKVEGRVRSLTAQGIAQGVIIVCMPFVLAFSLWLIDPVLISRLWSTWLGWVMIFAMLILQALGGGMIRKIVKIEV
jgi:tight adherence protein B